jgi:high frequency lysogenization protein
LSNKFSDRVLALAGLAQALQQVRRIAETGQSEVSVVRASLDSVFRIDAATPLDVYAGVADIAAGLRLLRGYLGSEPRDESLLRLAMSVLQLERRFSNETELVGAVGAGITQVASQARELGSIHPDVLSALGALYADTISQLRPRVMVQGNPHYLGQPGVVAEIRAILLAAVRSAVLWRQLGGSYWDFLFSRSAMKDAVSEWLR